MAMTAYNIQLKGCVGGADFDCKAVDKTFAEHSDKSVNVLIDSLGGSLATGLSISAAFKQHAYCGEWDSEEDFARHIVEECYDLELKIAEYQLNKSHMRQRTMGNLANYFDYEAFGRELL